MHLKEKVNNDLKLNINDQQRFIFKKKRRVQEVFLFTNYEEVFFGRNSSKRMATQPKIMAKKRSLLMRKTDKIGSALKYKLLMQSILINGKQVPVKR